MLLAAIIPSLPLPMVVVENGPDTVVLFRSVKGMRRLARLELSEVEMKELFG